MRPRLAGPKVRGAEIDDISPRPGVHRGSRSCMAATCSVILPLCRRPVAISRGIHRGRAAPGDRQMVGGGGAPHGIRNVHSRPVHSGDARRKRRDRPRRRVVDDQSRRARPDRIRGARQVHIAADRGVCENSTRAGGNSDGGGGDDVAGDRAAGVAGDQVDGGVALLVPLNVLPVIV